MCLANPILIRQGKSNRWPSATIAQGQSPKMIEVGCLRSREKASIFPYAAAIFWSKNGKANQAGKGSCLSGKRSCQSQCLQPRSKSPCSLQTLLHTAAVSSLKLTRHDRQEEATTFQAKGLVSHMVCSQGRTPSHGKFFSALQHLIVENGNVVDALCFALKSAQTILTVLVRDQLCT